MIIKPGKCIWNRHETLKKCYRQGAEGIMAAGILEYFNVKIDFRNAACDADFPPHAA